jgi:hypothetical protein
MILRKQPRKPKYVPYIAYPRFMAAVHVDAWREYLVHYVRDLEATG